MAIVGEQGFCGNDIPTVRHVGKILNNGQILLVDISHPQLPGLIGVGLEGECEILALSGRSCDNLERLEGPQRDLVDVRTTSGVGEALDRGEGKVEVAGG